MTRKRPSVLIVDDKPEELRLFHAGLPAAVRATVRHPSEVLLSDVRRASVLLMDWRIDAWTPEPALHDIVRVPRDGIAIASVLRSHLRAHDDYDLRAIVLHSANVAALSDTLSVSAAPQLVAKAAGVDWVLAKGSPEATYAALACLVRAVGMFPKQWPKTREENAKRLNKLLAVPSGGWRQFAVEEVNRARPPIFIAATRTTGAGLLRWLLQTVLPYPGFLIDSMYLSTRLGVEKEELEPLLLSTKKTRAPFAEARYTGALADFTGPRWWRSGVEHQLWRWTRGNPHDSSAISTAVRAHISKTIAVADYQRVVVVDADGAATGESIPIGDAVEIRPDDWPLFALPAWAAASDAVTDPDLRALVVEYDRRRL